MGKFTLVVVLLLISSYSYALQRDLFEYVKHFEPILMDENGIKEGSESLYKEISKSINNYADKKIKVTVIGHTDEPTDIYQESLIKSNPFMGEIEKFFKYSLSTEKSDQLSKSYAEFIKKRLLDDGIPTSVILTDFQGGKDNMYTDETSYARGLSNRVMVSLYVYEDIDNDSDLDGVDDLKDRCKGTLKGLPVDEHGCPFDDDNDGVYNYLDRCMATESGYEVDEHGCILK